jgi:hypothetical protein
VTAEADSRKTFLLLFVSTQGKPSLLLLLLETTSSGGSGVGMRRHRSPESPRCSVGVQ